jgi:hypothetical protein
MLRVHCDKCGRAGQLSVARLIDRYGLDTKLPDLLRLIAGCERAGSMTDPCGACIQIRSGARTDTE